jgi:hypothetical protein
MDKRRFGKSFEVLQRYPFVLVLQKGEFTLPFFEHCNTEVVEKILCKTHIVPEVSKGHFRFYHPEL